MWTTSAQTDFLYSKLPDYFSYQRDGRLIHFWPIVTREWKERFGETAADTPADTSGGPDPGPDDNTPEGGALAATASADASTSADKTTSSTIIDPALQPSTTTTEEGDANVEQVESCAKFPAIASKKPRGPPALIDRLKQWFSNRRGARSEVPARKRTTLSLSGKSTRKPHAHQIYQRLYYDKLKPIVAQRYAEHVHSVGPGARPQPLVAFRNTLCKQLLEDEDQDVRNHVYKAWDESKGRAINPSSVKVEIKDEELTDAEKHQMQLAYYENNICNLKATLQTVLRDIYLQTGWVLHIQGGGRRPGRGGAIQCISAHTRLPDGRNFANFNIDYMDAVQKPYGDWILSLFPPKEQAQYNLTSPDALRDGSQLAVDAPATGELIDGVEHLETIAVDAFPKAAEAATTATKRMKPRPRPVKRKTSSKASDDVPVPRTQAERARNAMDISDNEEDEWADLDYETLDQEKAKESDEAMPDVDPSIAQHQPSTEYERVRLQRMQRNRELLLSITSKARDQLGMPSSSNTSEVRPVPAPTPSSSSERSTRSMSKSSSANSSRAPSRTATQSSDGDFDMLDDDQDSIATYNDLAHLIDTDQFAVWDNIIDNAKTLERVLGYPASMDVKHRFSVIKRPVQVGAWTKRHRKLDQPPRIDDVPLFASLMVDWYVGAQPVGRGSELPLSRDELSEDEWACLIRGGANGWQIFLIAMTWWVELLEDEDDTATFQLVLDDVDWALSQVLDAARGRAGSKREAQGAPTPYAKRPKQT